MIQAAVRVSVEVSYNGRVADVIHGAWVRCSETQTGDAIIIALEDTLARVRPKEPLENPQEKIR